MSEENRVRALVVDDSAVARRIVGRLVADHLASKLELPGVSP